MGPALPELHCYVSKMEMGFPEVRHDELRGTGHRKWSGLATVIQARPLQEAWETPATSSLCLSLAHALASVYPA